ncbi:hypothetical protein AYL99_10442 [Fonsecaea erecta]|uniref:Uncharacterized protein n=1 Tax=Fonsecaea erecta TaxID=1367422 RepID=A0A178Z6S9_9EURO|nr:hypothetical protein AYL99_10442 [Fonsecaea erecta]OAP55469.1 hypothetical protein AYL99_10442 [Fonsecaea erecta]
MFLFRDERTKYAPVRDADLDGVPLEDGPSLVRSTKKFGLREVLAISLLTAFISSVLAIGATFAMSTLSRPASSDGDTSKTLDCGHSVAEARDKGCTFDPLTVAWLPAECPRDGADEFVAAANPSWRYWHDRQMEITGGYDNLSSIGGDGVYWTTTAEHWTHCVFMLWRVHAALARGRRVDWMTANQTHSHHCLMMLLEATKMVPRRDEIHTYGYVRFGSC